jgi:hypothetical protein
MLSIGEVQVRCTDFGLTCHMLSGFSIFHLDSKNAAQLWYDLYVWRLSSDQCMGMGVMLYARGCCDEMP